ncbi:hypothetical protein ABQE57_25745 [Mycolicibacterium elephantis]
MSAEAELWQPDRALPLWAVDLMVEGVDEEAARDSRKVWAGIMRIAMCAYRRGWTEMQFASELTKSDRKRQFREHRLWAQLRRSCSDKSAHAQVQKAWECAVANIGDVGERSGEDLRADAIERAYRWADRLTDQLDNLSPTEAAVLGYVISETERRGMTRVTCPVRAVAEAAKTSTTTASRHLDSLAERGFLDKFSRGRASSNPSKRRAAIYALADPNSLPVGGVKPHGRPENSSKRKGHGA